MDSDEELDWGSNSADAEQEEELDSSNAALPQLIPSRPPVVGHHIKKRALRNKALSVGFNDKELMDYVTGFHKRKKKRRKVAQKQLEEKDRLRRIELRKRRKMEKEFAMYGGTFPKGNPPENGNDPNDDPGDQEEDGLKKTSSVSGTKTYDNGGMTITVTTSEISHDDEDLKADHFTPRSNIEPIKSRSLPAKRKPFKKVAKKMSRKKRPKNGPKKKGKRSRNDR